MSHLISLQPVVSEKSLRLTQAGQYTFRVNRQASKLGIARAVSDAYKVSVKAVNIINIAGKSKQRGTKSALHKAIVTLKKGDRIKGFEMPVEPQAEDGDTKDKK